MSRPPGYGRPLQSGSVRRTGPWYDPTCRLCDFGWIDYTDDTTRNDKTMRCPDCEAKAQAWNTARAS